MGDPFTSESRATLESVGPSTTGTADDVTLYQPRALEPGEIIGHYRIEAPLGQGGNGTAYSARNIDDEDERVAIKLIRPDRRDRARLARLLRAEAAALRRVKHEGIVQYRTFKRIPESEEYYLVTEHIDGPTLGACLREKRLTPDQVCQLAIRVADALETAHEQGVIHRDLSPDNIILPDGNPMRATLIDFGIAKQGTVVDPFGVDFVGKLAFAAPEQFEGDPSRIGPWTDLYSLGLVLAAAARGQRLDMGRDMESAVEARRRLPDLSDLPETLRRPIARLLAADPEARIRSAAAAAALFAPATSDETIMAGGDGDATLVAPVAGRTYPTEVPSRKASRTRLAAIGAIAVVLLLGAVGAMWLMRGPAQDPPHIAGTPSPAEPGPPTTPPTATPVKLNAKVKVAATVGRASAILARLAEAQAMAAAKDADALVAKAHTVAGAAEQSAQSAREAAEKACNRPAEGYACTRLPDGSRQAGEQSCSGGSCVWNGYVSFATSTAIFEGQMEYGRFKLGKLIGQDGSIFSGSFQGTQPNGLGRLSQRDGSAYIGGFVNGALKGLGRLEFGDSDLTGRESYAGSFRAGLKDGPGVLLWRSGLAIKGLFAQDALTGYAVEQDSTERKEARYQDWFATMGVSHYPDGRRYEGFFGSRTAPDDDQIEAREGYGVLYAPDGAIEAQGFWRDDKLSEPMK